MYVCMYVCNFCPVKLQQYLPSVLGFFTFLHIAIMHNITMAIKLNATNILTVSPVKYTHFVHQNLI